MIAEYSGAEWGSIKKAENKLAGSGTNIRNVIGKHVLQCL
jgi:hypothetical protein